MADTMWRIPFGKYSGMDIENAPDHYLIWLKGEDWFKKNFAEERVIVEKELKYRNDFNLHIKR